MPTRINPQDMDVVLKFGGGLSTRSSEDEIDPREAADGQNFDLDFKNRDLKPRKRFDLIGTVPNASEIRGFINLVQTDGSISLLVQAGNTVYEWDGVTTFTSRGTVDANAKLRGRLSHNWQLTDVVLITDLNLQDVVMSWDGTTLADVTFTDENGAAFGAFKARYCTVTNERAIFANINEPGGSFPNLIVGSKRGDYTQITVSDRPASSLSAEDPFFVGQPDNRYINGLVEFYDNAITSSKGGGIFKMGGIDAQDFAMEPFYPQAGAEGDEALVNAGNDVMFGRAGRIESLISTEKSGDVETDDLTVMVKDRVETFDDWTLVYNSRTQRIHCLPVGNAEDWVYHKPLRGTELSPWMKWVTGHSSSFQPTAIMNMIDPGDGLEYTFFGDGSGNFYRLEGTSDQDADSDDLVTTYTSPLFKVPTNATAFDVTGYIKYRRTAQVTIDMVIEWAGTSVVNHELSIDIPADASAAYYGGAVYYGGAFYYGGLRGKLTRQIFTFPGQSNEAQIKISVTGSKDFQINEIGLRFEAAD